MKSIPKRIACLAALVVLIAATAVFAQFPNQWTRDPANPVLTDAIPSTTLFHEGVYKMWGEVVGGIGYATSSDGRVWETYTDNPVLVAGPEWYDVNEVASPAVVIVDGDYHMWYSGIATDEDNRISHATSPDGIVWVKDSANPVMDLGDPGSLDDEELIHPFVIYEEPVFRMWYNGHDGSAQRILYAISLDGVLWARNSTAALEPGEPGDWDDGMLAMMSVLPVGSFYYMFYTALSASEEFGIGYATSHDGVDWIKRSPSEPVLSPGDAGAWDDMAVVAPVVLQTATEFIMWYGGSSDFETFVTGIATASLPPVAVPTAAGIRLAQNFPNPFNPATTIRYDVPAAQQTRLAIYSVDGRRVATLVDGIETVGSYEVVWTGIDDHGRQVPSGVYFCRLDAGEYGETKRMALIR